MDSGTFRVLLRLEGCAKQLKKKDGGPNSVDDRICTEKLFSLGGTVARAKKPYTGYNARGDTVQFWPAVVSRSSPHLFTPPHFLSKILHCPIQIKAKKRVQHTACVAAVTSQLGTGVR